MAEGARSRFGNRSLIVLLVGALLALIGLVLTAGGIWLAVLGGSPYYLLAGLGLTAAGALMILGRPLGAYLYLGVFALTVLWALWEVGLNVWAL
jgi:quinoprotein glucose dehydrogenase